jgi:hypothetical protein
VPKNIEQPAATTEGTGEKRKRPDPLFKELLTEAAKEAGLKSEPTELQVQQTSTSDLLLTIPEGTALENTLFDFFRQANIIEFKSTNDPLDAAKFALQLGRVYFWFATQKSQSQSKARAGVVDFDSILNVIVSSRYPREFLKYSAEHGCTFVETPGREWLLQTRCGWQDVAIVVCERLPLEPKYERWLMFAPASSQTWRSFIKMLVQEQNEALLRTAQILRPKEFEMMAPELEKIMEQLEAEEPEQYANDWFEAIKMRLARLKPNQLAQAVAELPTEQKSQALAGLTPEERLAGLTPTEMQELLRDLQKKLGQQPN